MQAASDPLRGVQIHGTMAEGHGFLPLVALLSPRKGYSVWPNKGIRTEGESRCS